MFIKIEHISARPEVGEGSALSAIDWDQYRTTESEVALGNTSLEII